VAVREILLLGNPVLRTRCTRVEDFTGHVLRRTINDLRDTLRDFRERRGFGRGIAAPQIGATEQVIFIDCDTSMPMVNPVIVRRSRQMMTLWDDCFSFPDILVKLKRHNSITVKYRNADGKKLELEAAGALSELLQHEIDHINGVLAVDRAIDSRHIILRSEWMKLKPAAKQLSL
jgi:peptide deformylase